MWLRDVGYDGYADDLEHAVAGHAAEMAYEIADNMESIYTGDDMHQLVWHLRDWADRHEITASWCGTCATGPTGTR